MHSLAQISWYSWNYKRDQSFLQDDKHYIRMKKQDVERKVLKSSFSKMIMKHIVIFRKLTNVTTGCNQLIHNLIIGKVVMSFFFYYFFLFKKIFISEFSVIADSYLVLPIQIVFFIIHLNRRRSYLLPQQLVVLSIVANCFLLVLRLSFI